MKSAASGRIAHLDGIRGIAILAVIVVHWVGNRAGIGAGGYIGVDLFFVLSGFIITTLLIKRRPTYRRFIMGRVRRLYPPLLGLLIGGSLLAWLWPQSALPVSDTVTQALVAVTQGSSLWVAAGNPLGPFTITWSLAVEWMFYLLWPLGVSRLVRLPARRAAGWCLVAAAATYGASLFQSPWWFYYSPVARSAELLAGAALGFTLIGANRPTGRVWNLLSAAGMALVIGWTVAGPSHYGLIYRLVGLPVTCAIAAVWITTGYRGDGPAVKLLTWKPLTAVGLVSYSLYLWHTFPIALMDKAWMGLPPAVVASIGVGLALACTAVAWLLLERPFTRPARRPESQSAAPLAAVGPVDRAAQ